MQFGSARCMLRLIDAAGIAIETSKLPLQSLSLVGHGHAALQDATHVPYFHLHPYYVQAVTPLVKLLTL